MKRKCVIENAIGETRAAVYEGKILAELYTRRWSDADKPKLGDIFAGRVRRIEPSLGAAFIDLGAEPDGFFKFTTAPNAPRLTEGARVRAEITREGEADKGPNVRVLGSLKDSTPGRISGVDLSGFISARFPGITFEQARVNTLIEAIESVIAIPGGGTLAIEHTRALTAIDIDSGSAASPFAVAKAACPLIASQLRLRGIGGLIVTDFPNLRQRRQREELMVLFEQSFASDPNTVKFAPLSRFGTIEMSRARTGPSLRETLLDAKGEPSAETHSIEALRALEREAAARPGARLTLNVPEPVYTWLQSCIIDWQAPLAERIGARFTVQAGDKLGIQADR